MYKIVQVDEIEWSQPAENSIGALSKKVIDPEHADTKYINFRLGCYQPGTFASPHSHEDAENIFYILQGKGVAVLDGERFPIGPGTLIFIPAKVEHALYCTGDENLTFVFVASPPTLFAQP